MKTYHISIESKVAQTKLLTWNAEQIRIAEEEGKANALVGVLVALRANSTDYSLASFFTAAVDANLGLIARVAGRALVSNALTTGERVAVEP